jgi:ketosteroid isomerase-like protein
MQPRFELFTMRNTIINTEEVCVLGDRAYSHGTYTYEMTPKEGGEIRFISGKFLDILEKQVDGSWKIAIDCHNYNQPAE